MSNMRGLAPAPMDAEEQAVMMLAYYDVREVSDVQLTRIFNCTAGALTEVRKSDMYAVHLQTAQSEIIEREAGLDDSWDDLERRALGSLQESIEATADPRVLLAAAKVANAASRRGGTLSKLQQKKGSSVINVDAQTGPTKIVRLRSKFLEVMQSDSGVQRMVEREVTITAMTNGSAAAGKPQRPGTSSDMPQRTEADGTTSGIGDMNEDLKPSEVKHLLKTSLGIDPSKIRIGTRFGPDVDVVAEGLPIIDFETFDAENPLGE